MIHKLWIQSSSKLMILLRLRFEYYVSLSTYQYRSLQESLIFNLIDRPLFWPSALGHPFRPYSSIKSRMNRFGDLKHSISIKDIQLSSFRPSTFPFQFRPVSQIIHFFDCSILTHIFVYPSTWKRSTSLLYNV